MHKQTSLTGKHRLSVLALIAALLVSLLAACGGNEEKDKGAANAPSSANSGTEAAGAPVELSVYSYFFDKVTGSEPILSEIQKKLNIKIKFISVPYSDWAQKMNVLFASGDIPDIIMNSGYGTKDIYLQWIKEGMLLPLSDYENDYPNLKRQLAKFESLRIAQGGKSYGLPIGDATSDISLMNDHALYVRKDWLEKVGLPLPKTIDDFYAVAKAFSDSDPDGNGNRDTYGFSTGNQNWWSYPIYNAFGASADRWSYTDGQWQPEVISDQMKDGVAFLKKMYQEGILEPDFAINTDDQLREKFIAGKIGMMFSTGGGYNELYDKFASAYPDKDPGSLFTFESVGLAGKDGTIRIDSQGGWWGATSINAKLSDEKKKKALELLDYLLSDEGLQLTRYGVEGTHYKKEGDQFVTLLPKDEKTGNYKDLYEVDQSGQLKYLVTWDYSFKPDHTPHREENLAMAKQNADHLREDKLAYLNIDPAKLDPAIIVQLGDLSSRELMKLIMQSKNLDAEWADFVSRWKSAGGDSYIKETNAAAVEQGIQP